MTEATNIPAPRVPLIDRTGSITREWYQFFLVLFNRLGGGTGVDGDKGDITVSNSGNTFTIDPGTISTSHLGGDITPAGKALIDDLSAALQRETLGIDASVIPYTVGDISKWDGNVDPGEVDEALDQLALRTKTLEGSEQADPSFVSLVKWGVD
jgi:hypothetical protein